jgi:hypothetical protein
VAPTYIILAFDISSWFLRFFIFGVFGILALFGSTLVTLLISTEDREEFKNRWESDNNAIKKDKQNE